MPFFIVLAAAVIFGLSCVAAWLTHIVVCIKTATWVLLVIGIIVPPIGAIHGFMIWFS